MMQDHYRMLGLQSDADEESIKQAYRQMVRRFHPDRNPENAEARQIFLAVTEAYQVLSDPVRRAQYDQSRRHVQPSRPTRANGPQERGEDLLFRLELTFERAVLGGVENFSAPFKERCTACENTKDEAQEPCKICDGRGYLSKLKKVRLTIPAGVGVGTRLRIPKEGAPGRQGGPRGDLVVVLSIREHAFLRLDGVDLRVEVPMRATDLALGCEITVPTLEGPMRLWVPAGSQSGRVFSIPGKGAVQPKDQSRGALLVSVRAEIPETIDAKARELLKALQRWEAQTMTAFPRVEAYEKWLAENDKT